MIELVYFGTSDHSVILLEKIVTDPRLRLTLVITKPDKPVGRKAVLSPTPVKNWCVKNGIPFLTPSSLKKELSEVLSSLQGQTALMGLVADYGQIIPEEIINFFKDGLINIHFSLLPKYRGASPVSYALLNGDKETGITFIQMSKEMDKGPILQQIPYSISALETDESLYEKLFHLAAEKLYEVLEGVRSKTLKPAPQKEAEATYTTPSGRLDRTTFVLKSDARVDFRESPEKIERAIRAFQPWPQAWTTVGELAKYLGATLKKPEEAKLTIKLHKAHLEGETLLFDELQVESRNRFSFADFKNGYLLTN